MDIKQLEALGFYTCGGQIDRLGKNYGVLTKSGPVLTPEGEELVAALAAREVMAAVPPETPGPRRGRPKKVVEHVDAESDADLDTAISELIGD